MKNDITKQPIGSRALFNFVGCAVSIAVMALLALATRSPFVFLLLGLCLLPTVECCVG